MNNNQRRETNGSPRNTNQEKPETVMTILEDFCGYTTSGGLERVVGTKYIVLKILWVIIFFGALTAAILQLVTLFELYQRKPISTRISLEHSTSLPFPSVTFCNFNIIRKSQLANLSQSLQESFDEYNKKSNRSSKTAPVNRNVSSTTDDDEGISDPDELDDIQKASESVYRLLAEEDWNTLEPHGHQFRDMIHSCKFNGKDCRDTVNKNYWTWFWHYKFGNCYIFNPKVIRGVQRKGLKAFRSGISHGLELELDIQQKEYVELTEDAGIVLHISPRGQMAFPFEEGLSLAPGFSTSIGLRRVHIFREDPFKNGSCVTQRSAYSNRNIYANKFNVSYSKTACVQSCIALNQRKDCGCMEYKFNPRDKIVCDILNRTTVKCLRQVLFKARNNKLNCATSCPPPCREEVYKITPSFSAWPSSSYKAYLTDDLESEQKNHSNTGGLRNNMLKAQIFYQDLNYEKIQETISYGLENFMADIGGQLGLWLGVSVLTGAELVELVILLILHFFKRSGSHEQPKKNEVAMEEGNFT